MHQGLQLPVSVTASLPRISQRGQISLQTQENAFLDTVPPTDSICSDGALQAVEDHASKVSPFLSDDLRRGRRINYSQPFTLHRAEWRH